MATVLVVTTVAGHQRAHAEEKPRRIVSLNLCADQVLIDLVDPSRILSVTFLAADPRFSNVAAKAAHLRLNRGHAEQIIPLKPDLILAGRYTTPATVGLLRRIGMPPVIVPVANDMPGVRRAIRTVAAAVGEKEKGEKMIAAFDRRLTEVRPIGPARPLVAVYWPRGYTGGLGSLTDAVIETSGFQNLVRQGKAFRDGLLPLERLVTSNVEALVLPRTGGAPSRATEMLAHPVFRRFLNRTPHVETQSRLWSCGTIYVAKAVAQLTSFRRRVLERHEKGGQ